MWNLLTRLDDPQNKFPSLLIAGTKGKGSTAAICERILRAAGYKVGLFTSPHLHSFRERIRLNGEFIAEEKVISLTQKLKANFENTPDLTIFELITVVAFVAFAEAGMDAAVLEVGLGGRLDSTNVVDPAVAVITSISYDHTQILGDTLTLIAREKAGIIRPGALVISAPQVDEAMRVIEQVCQDRRARLVVIDRDWTWEMGPGNINGQSFSTRGDNYRLSLIGEHQVINAITSLAAVEGFVEQTGLKVPPEAFKTGLANVVWLGRMEILNRKPYLVVDGAMNGDSAKKLVQALRRYFSGRKKTFIFGASSDHPVGDMLAVLLPVSDQTLVVASRHPRSETPENLAAMATEMGYQATMMPDVSSALNKALNEAGQEDLICIAGSLFLVADAREAWLRRCGLPLPPIDPLVPS